MVIGLLLLWAALFHFESTLICFVPTGFSDIAEEHLLAVAVIPMAMSLLRYLSMWKDLGQYVFTSFGMMGDLRCDQ